MSNIVLDETGMLHIARQDKAGQLARALPEIQLSAAIKKFNNELYTVGPRREGIDWELNTIITGPSIGHRDLGGISDPDAKGERVEFGLAGCLGDGNSQRPISGRRTLFARLQWSNLWNFDSLREAWFAGVSGKSTTKKILAPGISFQHRMDMKADEKYIYVVGSDEPLIGKHLSMTDSLGNIIPQGIDPVTKQYLLKIKYNIVGQQGSKGLNTILEKYVEIPANWAHCQIQINNGIIYVLYLQPGENLDYRVWLARFKTGDLSQIGVSWDLDIQYLAYSSSDWKPLRASSCFGHTFYPWYYRRPVASDAVHYVPFNGARLNFFGVDSTSIYFVFWHEGENLADPQNKRGNSYLCKFDKLTGERNVQKNNMFGLDMGSAYVFFAAGGVNNIGVYVFASQALYDEFATSVYGGTFYNRKYFARLDKNLEFVENLATKYPNSDWNNGIRIHTLFYGGEPGGIGEYSWTNFAFDTYTNPIVKVNDTGLYIAQLQAWGGDNYYLEGQNSTLYGFPIATIRGFSLSSGNQINDTFNTAGNDHWVLPEQAGYYWIGVGVPDYWRWDYPPENISGRIVERCYRCMVNIHQIDSTPASIPPVAFGPQLSASGPQQDAAKRVLYHYLEGKLSNAIDPYATSVAHLSFTVDSSISFPMKVSLYAGDGETKSQTVLVPIGRSLHSLVFNESMIFLARPTYRTGESFASGVCAAFDPSGNTSEVSISNVVFSSPSGHYIKDLYDPVYPGHDHELRYQVLVSKQCCPGTVAVGEKQLPPRPVEKSFTIGGIDPSDPNPCSFMQETTGVLKSNSSYTEWASADGSAFLRTITQASKRYWSFQYVKYIAGVRVTAYWSARVDETENEYLRIHYLDRVPVLRFSSSQGGCPSSKMINSYVTIPGGLLTASESVSGRIYAAQHYNAELLPRAKIDKDIVENTPQLALGYDEGWGMVSYASSKPEIKDNPNFLLSTNNYFNLDLMPSPVAEDYKICEYTGVTGVTGAADPGRLLGFTYDSFNRKFLQYYCSMKNGKEIFKRDQEAVDVPIDDPILTPGIWYSRTPYTTNLANWEVNTQIFGPGHYWPAIVWNNFNRTLYCFAWRAETGPTGATGPIGKIVYKTSSDRGNTWLGVETGPQGVTGALSAGFIATPTGIPEQIFGATIEPRLNAPVLVTIPTMDSSKIVIDRHISYNNGINWELLYSQEIPITEGG